MSTCIGGFFSDCLQLHFAHVGLASDMPCKGSVHLESVCGVSCTAYVRFGPIPKISGPNQFSNLHTDQSNTKRIRPIGREEMLLCGQLYLQVWMDSFPQRHHPGSDTFENNCCVCVCLHPK